MDKSRSTRRRLIRAGTVGLVSSIAGCGGYVNEDDDIGRDYPEERETEDDEPDRDGFQRPAEPPATFQSDKRSDFTYHELPFQRELPRDPADMEYDGRGHPDNTLIHIEIDSANSATATIKNVNVTRDIDLTLHVRDANGAFQTATNTLTATTEDTHETRQVEFNLSRIEMPTGAGSICDLTGTDTHDGDDFTMLFKRHQFVGIPHKNGINWVNNENFNYKRWVDAEGQPQWATPKGVQGNPRTEPAGHVEHIDTEDERILFLATRNTVNDELYGVSAHVKHKPAQDYKNGSERHKYRYGSGYEAYFATDISHFQELATKTAEAITNIGITNDRDRLEALGDLFQMIPYVRQGYDPSPTVVLYDFEGDCSSKSILMACILQNSPWNIMPCYIDAEINNVGHWTIGLNLDDLGDVNPNSMSTITGPNGDEFAFFDMTYDSEIGEYTSGVENQEFYDLGDFRHNPGRRADGPVPNY